MACICIACVSGMLLSRSFWHKCFLTLVLVIRMYGKSGKWALKADDDADVTLLRPRRWSHAYVTILNPSSRLLGRICHCIQLFSYFCKQTVENLIRRSVLRRLIRFSTVCRCPTKRTLGLYGSNIKQGCILRNE